MFNIINEARRFHSEARTRLGPYAGSELYAYCGRIANANGETVLKAPPGVVFIEDEQGIAYTLTRGLATIACHLVKLSKDGSRAVAFDAFDGHLRVQ